MPGHVDVQTSDELRANVLGTTVEHVIRNLTGEIASVQATADPDPQDIVFEGSFEEVNRLFLENGWSDGLPIVPPTKEKIAEFLALHRPARPITPSASCCPTTAWPRCGTSRSTA